MARPWRLRHKLVVGLALVVGSVALLLGAAVFGLSSYFDAGRVTQHKLVELEMVQLLRDHADAMAAPARPKPDQAAAVGVNDELESIKDAVGLLRVSLTGYEETVARSPVAARAVHEYKNVPDMRTTADELFAAVTAEADRTGRPGRLIDAPAPAAAYKKLRELINSQQRLLVDDVQKAHAQSEANHRRTLWLAGTATAVAVVLVLTLLYYFRVWVFGPIAALQEGVRRVHHGDFGHPIDLPVQDELGELAAEFNDMAARLNDVYRTLEGQVNSRTRQLVRSERLVSVGFLAAGVAHEINNPLASIAFCAEALESRLRDGGGRTGADAAVVEKYLKMMQDEAQRCKQITQKLLDFSRSGGKREPADLAPAVAETIDMARMLPTAKGKTVRFNPASPVVLPVSVPDIKGVVLNLTVNALDSMDEGGQLTVDLAARGDWAELTFADTGCGMAADTLETIFEPFFTRSRTGNGTGLGLSISHQVVDQHGGTITAASAGPGRGSTFTVRLPLRPTTQVAESGLDDRPATVLFPGPLQPAPAVAGGGGRAAQPAA